MTMTVDGLLYRYAVLMHELEQRPVCRAFRAEPGTMAKLCHKLRQHIPVKTLSRSAPGGSGYFDGIRLEEDNQLPPGRVDMIDHRGRVMGIIEIIE